MKYCTWTVLRHLSTCRYSDIVCHQLYLLFGRLMIVLVNFYASDSLCLSFLVWLISARNECGCKCYHASELKSGNMPMMDPLLHFLFCCTNPG
jgi:hypothetical protein